MDRDAGRDLAARTTPDKQEVVAVNNADKIRSMSNERLAAWLYDHINCFNCPSISNDCHNNCAASLLAWLDREVEKK